MEKDTATQIIARLSNGVDPFSGDSYPKDSPYNRIEVVNALQVALDLMNPVKTSSESVKVEFPKASGKPWSAMDEELLIIHFEAGITHKAIAKELKRTEGAIKARLGKLGLIDYDWDRDKNK